MKLARVRMSCPPILGPLDLDVCLVHPPGTGAWPQVAPDPVLKPGGIGLHPTEQGGVIDRDAPVRQHGREIAIADWKRQILAQCPQDHLRREVSPLKGSSCPSVIMPVPRSRR